MMSFLSEWLPWILLILLCGAINAIVAYQKLYRDAKSPFFQPWRIFGFYLWFLIQLALPGAFFWFYTKLSTKPAINPELFLTSIAIGFFFMLFVNSNSDLGFVSFSIDKYYQFLNLLAYNQIAASQTGKITRFKQALQEHFVNSPNSVKPAIEYLQLYVDSDISLKFEEETRKEYQKQLEAILQQSDPFSRAKATIGIVQKILRRHDYPDWLQTAKIPQPLIDGLKK
jgi:hypothetical protein